jgi:uncharacterized protein (DUF2267 family)
MLVRGVFFEGWRIGDGAPTKERHLADFLDHVNAECRGGVGVAPEAAVRAVFDVMWRRLDPGETAKLLRILPNELRQLWPAAAL